VATGKTKNWESKSNESRSQLAIGGSESIENSEIELGAECGGREKGVGGSLEAGGRQTTSAETDRRKRHGGDRNRRGIRPTKGVVLKRRRRKKKGKREPHRMKENAKGRGTYDRQKATRSFFIPKEKKEGVILGKIIRYEEKR